jgi:hypothetical protein
MLDILLKALADNNGVVMARICSVGQKMANERPIIAADAIGIAVRGGEPGEFYVQPWSNIAWIAVP